MRTARGFLSLVLWACWASGAVASAQEAEATFWNGNPAAPHLDIVGDEGGGELRPIRIVGARNGRFSGKVVVCSAGALKSISAKVSDLQAADRKSTIPASQVQMRFATGWLKSGWNVQPKAGSTFDILSADAPDDEVPPIAKADKYHPWVKTGRSYLPVWVTVTVPPEAPEGEYAGRLTVTVGGASRVIEVALAIHGYTLPGPRDYKTWIETIQSPDTLALEYGVPLWSERHWQLIEQSLRYGALLGNKTAYFPLLCESNFGNAESAVRWVKGGAGEYAYDFRIVERYLDLQTKVQGKPQIVCFPIWDTFLEGGQFSGDIKYEPKEARTQRLAYRGSGPEVTLLDAATGKTAKLMLPQFSDPASAALWMPLLRQLPDLLRKRGLEEALFFGVANDAAPHPSCLDLVGRSVPGAKWVIHAHSFYGGKDKKANFQYAAFVWGVKGFCTGEKGWEKPFLLTQFLRNMADHYPITTYRLAPEVNITGGQRGLGRIGLDYWPVLRNPRGVRSGRVSGRYPKASWRNLNITDSLLAPGKDGPLATARFEMLLEGVQECEARIAIQTALDGGKVPPPLADECRHVLARRDEFLKKAAIVQGTGRLWFADATPSEEAYLGYAAGWQEQSGQLYRAAAGVANIAGKHDRP
ncbi:MAG TPA: glycoside hydrolase domain-containing protein [Planctomycetota bacterium]|nr:glycoside hydrolase domain-containing protein [Planctomycetota bacterium]